MWRIGLAVVGGILGVKLAKSGKSHRNLLLFTASAVAMYKLTEWDRKYKVKRIA